MCFVASVYNSLSRFVQNTGELLGRGAERAVSGIVQFTDSPRLLDLSRKASIAILLVSTGIEAIQQYSGEAQYGIGEGRIEFASLRAAPYLIALTVSELFKLTDRALRATLAQFEEGQVIPEQELDRVLSEPVQLELRRDADLDRARQLFVQVQAEDEAERAQRWFLRRDAKEGYLVMNGNKLEFKPPVNL